MARKAKANPLTGEDALASRIAYERERRHWTPGGLARKVTAAGCPMNQSAIWKIEKGTPRRKITVDEAVAFAKVFDVTVEDLLLPPELVEETAVVNLLYEYRHHFDEAYAARARCDETARDLEDLLSRHPHTRSALRKALTETFADSPWVDEVAKAREAGVPVEPGLRWSVAYKLMERLSRLSEAEEKSHGEHQATP